jgi:hypothetical protein
MDLRAAIVVCATSFLLGIICFALVGHAPHLETFFDRFPVHPLDSRLSNTVEVTGYGRALVDGRFLLLYPHQSPGRISLRTVRSGAARWDDSLLESWRR